VIFLAVRLGLGRYVRAALCRAFRLMDEMDGMDEMNGDVLFSC
jgi:hypothetical protein